MAGLKILRVFLVMLIVPLIEIRCEGLVNEDYYSLEYPTPANNGNIVTQTTWTDAATSEQAINIMEVDVGSGEGDINQSGDKTGDLSTDRDLSVEQQHTEDLPSADEIFKAFENDSLLEVTTVTVSDLETTKNEHIKQIFEKLGVTKDVANDLYWTAPTEATYTQEKDAPEEGEEGKNVITLNEAAEPKSFEDDGIFEKLGITKDVVTDSFRIASTEATLRQQEDIVGVEDAKTMVIMIEADTKSSHQIVDEKLGESEDVVTELFRATSTEATLLQQEDIVGEEDAKTMVTMIEVAGTKNSHQILDEKLGESEDVVTDSFRATSTKATLLQQEDIVGGKDAKTMVTMTETAGTNNSHQILKKLGTIEDVASAVPTEATLLQQEEDKTMATITDEIETKKSDSRNSILLLNASLNGNLQIANWEQDNFLEAAPKGKEEETVFDSSSKNYEFEEKLQPSEEEKLSSLVFSDKSLTEQDNDTETEEDEIFTTSTEITHTTTSMSTIFDETASSVEINYENYYTNSLEENHKFRAAATVDPALYEYEARSNEDETGTTPQTNSNVDLYGHRQNKGLDIERKMDKINNKLDFESSTTDEGEIFKETTDFEAATSETTESSNTVPTESTTKQTDLEYSTEELELDTTRILVDFGLGSTRRFLEEGEGETSTKDTLDDFETTKWKTNRFPIIDEEVISVTTHTPTARILTESVSLVTDSRVENPKLDDPQINPCLKLNFTGQIITNESVIAIPNNASVFGTCNSNEVFVNITWQYEYNIRVNLFLNFTEELLTNIQMNLQHDNLLFEQSKKVEIGSTNREVQIGFDDGHTLELAFFEFSTRYDNSSLVVEELEPIPASEELQSSKSLLLQIVVGCVGLIVVLAVAGFYVYKKYWRQRDNFKPAATA